MPRRSKIRQLDAWMNGERVGRWTIAAQGQHEFRYDEHWPGATSARPISLSMPLQPPDVPYKGAIVENFFENLLPDSADIRRRIQARFGTGSTKAFDLLAEIGRDCVGAIQLVPADSDPGNVRQILGEPLDEAGVARVLRAAAGRPPLGQDDSDDFRISIAGAQEKTALLWHDDRWHKPVGATPTTHLFKLPLGIVGNMQADLSTSVENEWLCGRILRAFGFPVAECQVATFEDQKVLIVTRFDRKLNDSGTWWLRLPQEDMCQATATPPAQRYESDGGPGIQEIAALLLGSRNADADRRTFFRAQVLYWMLCATDGHAKNFSVFIERLGRYTLTPLYDILSAYPLLGTGKNQLAPQKAKMAMAITGKNRHYRWAEIQPRHWLATAGTIGIGSTADDDIAELVADTASVIVEVSRSLPADFPGEVSGPVLDGLATAARRLAEIA